MFMCLIIVYFCVLPSQFHGQQIKWKHLVELYEWDLGLTRAPPGLRKMHCLTEHHIVLRPRLRMRVNPAAQVITVQIELSWNLYSLNINKGGDFNIYWRILIILEGLLLPHSNSIVVWDQYYLSRVPNSKPLSGSIVGSTFLPSQSGRISNKGLLETQ